MRSYPGFYAFLLVVHIISLVIIPQNTKALENVSNLKDAHQEGLKDSDELLSFSDGNGVFSYNYLKEPVCPNDPAVCRPMGLGDIQAGVLTLRIKLPRFDVPIDAYLGIYAPHLSDDIFLLGADGTFHALSQGIVAWHKNFEDNIDEVAIPEIETSILPKGAYVFYLLVTPHDELSSGRLDQFYLWSTTLVMGPCDATPELGFNVLACKDSPAVQEQDGLITIGTLGTEGAKHILDEYYPSWDLCDVELSSKTSQGLQNALTLLDSGDISGAVEAIRQLIQGDTKAFITSLRQMPSGGWREKIKAGLDFYSELLLRNQFEEAQRVADLINDYFRQNALKELETADLRESFRICEEALLLGVEDVTNRAKERIRNIAKENLEAELDDFNPCIPNPDVLSQMITDLLKALRLAMAVGVEEALNGGSLYTRTVSAFEKAVQNYNSLKQGKGIGIKCGLGFSLSLDGAMGLAHLNGHFYSCSGIEGPWHGEYTISFNDTMNFACEFSGTLEFSVDPNTLKAEGTFTSGTASCQSLDPECVVNSASAVISYQIIFSQDGSSAEVTMGSTGGGSFSETCCSYGQCDTMSGPYAYFFGVNTSEVTISPYGECD